MKHLKRINENFLESHEGLEDILIEISDIIKPLVDPRPIMNNEPSQPSSGNYGMSHSYKYSHYSIMYNIPSSWDVDQTMSFYSTFKTIIRRIENWCSNNKYNFKYTCSNGLRLYFTIENDMYRPF